MIGLGDACGTNPCTWWDDIYVRDACLNYLACADPTNPLYVGATKGGLYLAGQAVGSAAGTAVTELTGGAASGIASAANASPTSLAIIGGVAILGLFVLIMAVKR